MDTLTQANPSVTKTVARGGGGGAPPAPGTDPDPEEPEGAEISGTASPVEPV